MYSFYKNIGFIISFSIATLAIEMTMGESMTIKFLALVLIGMVILNSQKIIDLLNKSFTVK